MTKWISVKEKVPDDADDVLVAYKQSCEHCARYDNEYSYAVGYLMDGKWRLTEPLADAFFPNEYYIKVSHWLPLPEPP